MALSSICSCAAIAVCQILYQLAELADFMGLTARSRRCDFFPARPRYRSRLRRAAGRARTTCRGHIGGAAREVGDLRADIVAVALHGVVTVLTITSAVITAMAMTDASTPEKPNDKYKDGPTDAATSHAETV